MASGERWTCSAKRSGMVGSERLLLARGRAGLPGCRGGAVARGGEEGELGEGQIGVGDGGGEQELPVAEPALDGLGLEELGAVLPATDEAVGAVVDLDVEVKLRRLRLDVHLGNVPSGGQPRQRWLQAEHDLEEGVLTGEAVGMQLTDQVLEGEFLMGMRLQADLTDPPQQLTEGGISSTSVRITSVLRKYPIMRCISWCVRPPIVMPSTTSSWPERRAKRAVREASRVM